MRELRAALVERVAACEPPVGVALSGGVDSSSLLAACRIAGVEAVALSFTLDDRDSKDFLGARKTAEHFDTTFLRVALPLDVETLRDDVRTLVREYDARKKVPIECGWPFIYLFAAAADEGLQTVLIGEGADSAFGLSKKAMMHHRHTIGAFDRYRRYVFSKPNGGGNLTMKRIGEHYGVTARFPYRDPDVIELFLGLSWEALNKPRQKEAIRAAFPELDVLHVRQHTNLQLGDSGISEHFRRLLDTDWNVRHYRSPVGVYNAVARGEAY